MANIVVAAALGLGWARSRPWIWLFSSTHRTSARSGGFR